MVVEGLTDLGPRASIALKMLKMLVGFVLASFGLSTYRAYWRQSTYPLACDRSERFKRSLVCTSSVPHSLRPCRTTISSILNIQELRVYSSQTFHPSRSLR